MIRIAWLSTNVVKKSIYNDTILTFIRIPI